MRHSCRSNRIAIAALSLFVTKGVCFAQVTVEVGSASAVAGGAGSANISISTTSGNAPPGVQWTLTYSETDISRMTLVPAIAITSAGKAISCATGAGSVKCIVSGLNTTPIPSGIIATANFSVSREQLNRQLSGSRVRSPLRLRGMSYPRPVLGQH